MDFFTDCVIEMKKYNDLSDFFIADNVGKLNELLEKANEFYFTNTFFDLLLYSLPHS